MKYSNQKKNDKKTSNRIKILGGIVLLLLVAFLFYFLFIPRQKEVKAPVEENGKVEVTSSISKKNTITYDGKRYQYNEHLSNFLFLGIDSREKMDTSQGQANAGQSDALFVLSWDRVKHSLTIISIPRDTMTQIETFDVSGNSLGMSTDHISLAYAFGDGGRKSCELAKTAVSNLLYQVPIQGYCALNLDGLPLLAKAVGGIPITVPDDSLEQVNPEFQEGQKVILNENNIETFVRYRDITQSQSAITRLNRQKVFLDAYESRAIETFNGNPGFISDLYMDLQNYMVTNMGTDQFVKIMEDASSGSEKESLTIPGEGIEGKAFDEYQVNDEKLYEMMLQVFYEETE